MQGGVATSLPVLSTAMTGQSRASELRAASVSGNGQRREGEGAVAWATIAGGSVDRSQRYRDRVAGVDALGVVINPTKSPAQADA